MAIQHNLPFYYRNTDPGANNTGITSKLYQWDEAGNKPQEISDGLAKMAPRTEPGHYILWSDTTTLGYDNIENAPIYFSDGGSGDNKILQIINHVRNRLDLSLFSDATSAKAWAASDGRVYVGNNITNLNTASEAYIENNPVTVASDYADYTGDFWSPSGGGSFTADFTLNYKLDIGLDTTRFHNGLRRGYIGTENGAMIFDYWTKDWQYIPTDTSISPIFQGARGSETLDPKLIFNYDYSTAENPRTWSTWGGGTGGYSNPPAFTNLGGAAGGELGRGMTIAFSPNDINGSSKTAQLSSIGIGDIIKIKTHLNGVKYFLATAEIEAHDISAAYGGGSNFDEAYTFYNLGGLIAISSMSGDSNPLSVRSGNAMTISVMHDDDFASLSDWISKYNLFREKYPNFLS